MNTKTAVMSLLGIVIFSIIAFTIIGDQIDDVQSAGDSLGDAGCGGNTTWDSVDNQCEDSKGVNFNGVGSTPPLVSFFDGNGVLLLVLMAAIVIGLIVMFMRYKA